MVLVDSSVWMDHLRRSNAVLDRLLEASLVLSHPFVIGEIVCGSLRDRAGVVDALGELQAAPEATHGEALGFLIRHRLHGRGIGWIDLHLLASTALTGGAKLWTRDHRLHAAARELDLAYEAASS